MKNIGLITMKTLHSLVAGFRPASSIPTRWLAFLLLSLGTALMLVQPCAAAPFKFEETGSLAEERLWHTATLMSDGKVLVAGGTESVFGDDGISSAEFYDPATGIWTSAGELAHRRFDHTATLLTNGKVLVVGGSDDVSDLAIAELYDLQSRTWTETGSLIEARAGQTATLLPNGMVLVAGGVNNGTYLATAELYDPKSGTWASTGSLATNRAYHTATLLPNGMVLVTGGFSRLHSDIPGTVSAELYDPKSGTWTATGSLAHGRYFHTATLLPNGKVLVAAGYGGFVLRSLKSAELYDPASGVWTVTDNLAEARHSHTATLLPNG